MTDELMSEIKAPRMNGSIITVVGVGGAGGNAVNHMWNLGIRGVTFMVCNTDQQALDKSPVELKIRLGAEGLGAGNDPENGRRAAVESLPEIRQTLEESVSIAATSSASRSRPTIRQGIVTRSAMISDATPGIGSSRAG